MVNLTGRIWNSTVRSNTQIAETCHRCQIKMLLGWSHLPHVGGALSKNSHLVLSGRRRDVMLDFYLKVIDPYRHRPGKKGGTEERSVP